MEETWEDFRKKILKVNLKRNIKITGAWGVYDAYKAIRKNKWFDIGRPVLEHEFYSIIRSVNKLLVDDFIKEGKLQLPKQMGTLVIRHRKIQNRIKNNKLCIEKPIDWLNTLKLWYDNNEAYAKKILVRQDVNEDYNIFYDKFYAKYNNKIFFLFLPHRPLKNKLRTNMLNHSMFSYTNGIFTNS